MHCKLCENPSKLLFFNNFNIGLNSAFYCNFYINFNEKVRKKLSLLFLPFLPKFRPSLAKLNGAFSQICSFFNLSSRLCRFCLQNEEILKKAPSTGPSQLAIRPFQFSYSHSHHSPSFWERYLWALNSVAINLGAGSAAEGKRLFWVLI